MSHLFCFGLGFSARALARRLLAQAWRVTGTSRTPEGAAALSGQGYHGLVFDGRERRADIAAALATATHVLVSIAPDARPASGGDPVLSIHADDLEHCASLAWVGYLSTIGVYGDRAGAWIDETATVAPGSDRSKRRTMAEHEWQSFNGRSGKPVQIFRLAGIYGPGRSAIDNLRDGSARRIIKPGQVFNRIHVEDIATVLQASILRPNAGAIYNVTDDEPAPPQDVVAFAAQKLGLDVPPDLPFDSARLSDMGRSFYAENKRVSNGRIKRELGVVLRYPTYREGIAALARDSN